MRGVSGGHDVLIQHAHGIVLTRLELIADDGEFFIEIGLADEGVYHAVSFQIEGPFQILVRGLEGLIVIGTVVGCRTVGASPVFRKFLRDIRVFGAAFEDHVLQ